MSLFASSSKSSASSTSAKPNRCHRCRHLRSRRRKENNWAAVGVNGKEKVATLRQALANHKDNLSLSISVMELQVHDCGIGGRWHVLTIEYRYIAKEAKTDTAEIQKVSEKIPQVMENTEAILEEISRLRQQLTEKKNEESYMLQYYLELPTSYAESVINGDSVDTDELKLPQHGSPPPFYPPSHRCVQTSPLPRVFLHLTLLQKHKTLRHHSFNPPNCGIICLRYLEFR